MENLVRNIPHIRVDFSQAAETRWDVLRQYKDVARRLLQQYVADFGGIEHLYDEISLYREQYMAHEQQVELTAIAQLLDTDLESVTLGNLYYDAIKFVIGCTAFAVDTEEGPLHARNLDWWTENNLLAEKTIILRGEGAGAGPFQLVTWPGFIGAFSGMAEGRFAITLNAVSSNEPFELATPITFLLRSVFETARSFQEAVDRLVHTPIASDCLLLVTGTKRGEMVVIERTPTRAALRYPQDGRIVVANDYQALHFEGQGSLGEGELQQTSCRRFDRATALLEKRLPTDSADCFTILTDERIRMRITVQHMVMSAAKGMVELKRASRSVV
jgi:acid ceramidase